MRTFSATSSYIPRSVSKCIRIRYKQIMDCFVQRTSARGVLRSIPSIYLIKLQRIASARLLRFD